MIVDYFVSSEDVLLTADIVDDNDNVITSAAEGGLMFCFGFIFIYLFFLFFNDSVRPIICWTDPRQICRVDWTMAVDERGKLIFRSLKGRCRGN